MTNSLRLHGLQHARLFCPPLSPGVCSDSCLLSVMLSNHPVLCYPILLCLSSFPASEFSPGGKGELALCTRWPKYWSFSISSFNEYSGLIYFWVDYFDLLAVRGTLKSLLQHRSSKASILPRSAFKFQKLQLTSQTGYQSLGEVINEKFL